MAGAGSKTKHDHLPITPRPPKMRSAGMFRAHRFNRRMEQKRLRQGRKKSMHALISMKSGARLENVDPAMQTLPLVVFQGVMGNGEACIDNLVMLTGKITAGKAIDVAFNSHGVVKKAFSENL